VSLQVVVAAPFRQAGRRRLGEGKFVVELSMEYGWFSPDQAKRVVDVATGRGLVERDGDELVVQFDPREIDVPEGFEPDEDVLREQSTFERLLDAIVAAGVDKQTAVAEVNRCQREFGVTIEAAAVLYARRHDVDVATQATRAREELVAGPDEPTG
jgi:hypothetical protein